MKNNSRVSRYDKSIFKKFWFWLLALGVLLILIFAVYSASGNKTDNASDKKSTAKNIKTNKNKTREETMSKDTTSDSLKKNKFDKQPNKQQPNSSEAKKQATANNKQNNVNSGSGTTQNTVVNNQQTENNNVSNNGSDQYSNQNDSKDDIKRNWVNDPSAQTYTKEQAQKIVSENNGAGEYNITPDNSNPEYMGNMNGTQTFGSTVTQHLYDAANGN